MAPPARPRGRGTYGGYLSVAEVDQRIDDLAARHAGAVRLIDLPHRTWEDRKCRAIRIGSSDTKAPAVVLLGGVHAREWGSPDILVAFAERLLSAWQSQKGIAVGHRRFRASSVQQLIEETAVFIVPQVNPDGRHHSLTIDPLWRKNRRPAPSERDGDETCIGVDVEPQLRISRGLRQGVQPRCGRVVLHPPLRQGGVRRPITDVGARDAKRRVAARCASRDRVPG